MPVPSRELGTMASSWLLAIAPILLFFFLVPHHSKKRPPGPRAIPLLGNALQMPTSQPWIKFSEWASVYGGVIYVEALGTPIVILNSLKAIQDLMNHRSSIYSDRPYTPMVELATADRFFALQKDANGEEWREQRKLVTFGLNSSMLPTYRHLKEQEARRLVQSLLGNPEDLFPEVNLRIASIIMRVNYGYYPVSIDDPIVAVPLKGFTEIMKAFDPWLVNILPPLRHLPPWFPGTKFLQVAKNIGDLSNQGFWEAYRIARKNMEEGTTLQPNLCETILSAEEGPVSNEKESRLVYGLGALLFGGLDTSAVTTLVFFLFMVRHPEIQHKARQEIDRVVGRDRLPTVNDQNNLPYIRSIMMETIRICPPLPLGAPHCVNTDDVYNDYFIPKGATIIPNIYHILRDPDVFPNPDVFDPDRYNLLDAEMHKVTDLAFGFGRRRCPGAVFAIETVFAIIVTVLATCYIVPQVDDDGNEIVPEFKLKPRLVVFPEEFRCKLVCRSEAAMELLQSAQTNPLV